MTCRHGHLPWDGQTGCDICALSSRSPSPDPSDAAVTEHPLPPGPYRVEWPDHQGGWFKVWGNQGTPPDFADGWAIPLVAMGTQSPMEWLAAHLNAAHGAAMECPMCGGIGRIFDITVAIEQAQAAGTLLTPLASPSPALQEPTPNEQ